MFWYQFIVLVNPICYKFDEFWDSWCLYGFKIKQCICLKYIFPKSCCSKEWFAVRKIQMWWCMQSRISGVGAWERPNLPLENWNLLNWLCKLTEKRPRSNLQPLTDEHNFPSNRIHHPPDKIIWIRACDTCMGRAYFIHVE